MKIYAYGKINLCLDVLGEREDGYHDIDTIMQQIQLHDILTLKEIPGEELEMTTNREALPMDETNLVYKAWKALKEYRPRHRGLSVHIDKRIPLAAGLAGGSSDCAAVLKGLQEMWELDLSSEDLMEIGVKLGADVPYFFVGQTARAQGIGDVLTPLRPFKQSHILLVNNGKEISTQYVYEHILPGRRSVDVEGNVAMINGEKPLNFDSFQNVMEEIGFALFDELASIKEEMIRHGALHALMSGSGPTMFGIYEDAAKLQKAYDYFSRRYEQVYMTATR